MIIDISGGANAESYPVIYTNCPPPGGWTEEYKTTKLVLRRVEAGSFMMGSPITENGRSDNEDYHKVTLTKPYYIGVFEVTERQYAQISGNGTGTIKPKILQYGDIRGSDVQNTSVSGSGGWNYTGSKTSYCWPDSNMVNPNSFMGKLRTKTGMTGFDLPTEAQWEYAARGGCEKAINLGYDYSDESACLAGRSNENRNDGKVNVAWTDVTAVGCYIPNSLGLYDMLGNASEFCNDVYKKSLGNNMAIDPVGGVAELSGYVSNPGGNVSIIKYMVQRVIKGGGYSFSSYERFKALRCGQREPSLNSSMQLSLGFRVCCRVE
jgi:formylglycine-generating enzyme required for sulfatase activity